MNFLKVFLKSTAYTAFLLMPQLSNNGFRFYSMAMKFNSGQKWQDKEKNPYIHYTNKPITNACKVDEVGSSEISIRN